MCPKLGFAALLVRANGISKWSKLRVIVALRAAVAMP